MFVGGLTGCYYGVLPEAIDRPFRWFVWGCYLTLLTDLTEVCMDCYQVFVWSLTRVY